MLCLLSSWLAELIPICFHSDSMKQQVAPRRRTSMSHLFWSVQQLKAVCNDGHDALRDRRAATGSDTGTGSDAVTVSRSPPLLLLLVDRGLE